MTVEKSDRKAGVPPAARRATDGATDGESRRIAKASAVLRCLVLVSRQLSDEPIGVELGADVA